MSERERYDDPAFARRVRDWVDDAAPSAAPERLVFAVMDEVERTPRAPRLPLLGLRPATLWQYVALTVVIAIGVAAGTLLTRDDVAAPSASPTSPTRTPSVSAPAALPTLAIVRSVDVGATLRPSAIAVVADSLWVGTAGGWLIEFDAANGQERSRIETGLEPIQIVFEGGRLWLSGDDAALIWVDPESRSTGSIPGAGGHHLNVGAGGIWVSQDDVFVRVDPASVEIAGSLDVPGHLQSEPSLIVGDELWAGTGGEISRFGLADGVLRGTIPVHPSGLLAVPDGVLAVQNGTLLRIAGPEGPLVAPTVLLDDVPNPVGEAYAADRVWLTGDPQGRRAEVVEIDLAGPRIVARTAIPSGTRAIAVVGDSIWVASMSGQLVQLRAAP